MNLRILPAAKQDLLDGHRFYEKQAPGIGNYFFDTLVSDIDALLLTAGIHPIHFGKYHRMLSKRFPFAVYYRVEEETVVVYAVADCRRRPAWIRNRLG